MKSNLLSLNLMLAVCLTGAATAGAQEFRIYTKLVDQSSASREVIAHSLTVFHAGKAYDWVDTAGEVTVFEPAHHRFTILSTKRGLVTTVAFDELKFLLKKVQQEAEAYAARLEQESPDGSREAGPIRFQLAPMFSEQFDSKQNRLTLSSPFLRYDVDCAPGTVPERVETYLQYADWTARINSVLHPQSLFPGPRLALNERLRERGLLPVNVELKINADRPVSLRAEHQIRWELQTNDRALIHEWDTRIRDPQTKHLKFREFQQALLAGKK